MDVFTRITVIVASAEMMHTHIPATTSVGVVSRKASEQRIHCNLEYIASPLTVEFQPGTIRAYSDHSAATELHFASVAADGIHKTKVADGKIQPTIDPHRYAIARVIRRSVFESKSDVFDEDLLAI